jgi:hypothetical protein
MQEEQQLQLQLLPFSCELQVVQMLKKIMKNE